MSTKIKYGTGLLLALFFLLVLCPSAFAEDGRAWTWLSSNDKYSKFYAPASVHVMQGATAAGTGKTVARRRSRPRSAMRARRRLSATIRSGM